MTCVWEMIGVLEKTDYTPSPRDACPKKNVPSGWPERGLQAPEQKQGPREDEGHWQIRLK